MATPAQVMVLTAAFTDMRWGEISGLGRANCHPDQHFLIIDSDIGSLHEVGGRLWLGPPKTGAAARRIDLPAFLAEKLAEVMDSHDHEQVFVTAEGHWHRRSNFARRIWRIACDGDPDRGWAPLTAGAVFHGLRHHHKTILDELHVEEVLKCERMGHHMPGIGGVYSHVTESMRKRLTDQLQRHWAALTGRRRRRR